MPARASIYLLQSTGHAAKARKTLLRALVDDNVQKESRCYCCSKTKYRKWARTATASYDARDYLENSSVVGQAVTDRRSGNNPSSSKQYESQESNDLKAAPLRFGARLVGRRQLST